MFILPKYVAHLFVVIPLKKYSPPSAWQSDHRALEADVVSPYAVALSSSRLPNVTHTSILPATCLCTPLILRIYSQSIPMYVIPLPNPDAGD